jgi:hypothetical protein
VGDRPAIALDVEVVVAERVVLAPEVGVLGFGQPAVGDLRVLGQAAEAEGDALVVADPRDVFQVEVSLLEVLVLARGVALAAHRIEQKAATADVDVHVAPAAVAGGELRVAGEFLRRRGRDVVDHAADGLRPEAQHAHALEHLHPRVAVERRVVVTRVVAVGCVRRRDAVLQQQHLRRARGVEAADADVGPQAETLLVAHVEARHLAQGLADGERAAAFEFLLLDHRRAAGLFALRGGVADHLDLRQLDIAALGAGVGGGVGGRGAERKDGQDGEGQGAAWQGLGHGAGRRVGGLPGANCW